MTDYTCGTDCCKQCAYNEHQVKAKPPSGGGWHVSGLMPPDYVEEAFLERMRQEMTLEDAGFFVGDKCELVRKVAEEMLKGDTGPVAQSG